MRLWVSLFYGLTAIESPLNSRTYRVDTPRVASQIQGLEVTEHPKVMTKTEKIVPYSSSEGGCALRPEVTQWSVLEKPVALSPVEEVAEPEQVVILESSEMDTQMQCQVEESLNKGEEPMSTLLPRNAYAKKICSSKSFTRCADLCFAYNSGLYVFFFHIKISRMIHNVYVGLFYLYLSCKLSNLKVLLPMTVIGLLSITSCIAGISSEPQFINFKSFALNL